MLLIPAIDLHEGRCVQLQRGLLDSATTYSEDPYALARHWIELGAERIHVVDLDGAFAGRAVNRTAVERIIEAAGSVPIQLGGGIRNSSDVQRWLSAGISQVIVGTFAAEQPHEFMAIVNDNPDQLILGVDARDGKMATRGWSESTELLAEEFITQFDDVPLHSLVYTDIERDGMLSGINWLAMRSVLTKSCHNLIASGGVHGLADLDEFKKLATESTKLRGLISGSALYEGKLDFVDAQRRLRD